MTKPDEPDSTATEPTGKPVPKKTPAARHHIPHGKPGLAQSRKGKPIQAARQGVQRLRGR